MNTPRYGKMISAITQITLAQPDMSRRRNRSPKTVISNQNHSTKMNIEKTSARKLGNVKPPGNNMPALPSFAVENQPRHRKGSQPSEVLNRQQHSRDQPRLRNQRRLSQTPPPVHPRAPPAALPPWSRR